MLEKNNENLLNSLIFKAWIFFGIILAVSVFVYVADFSFVEEKPFCTISSNKLSYASHSLTRKGLFELTVIPDQAILLKELKIDNTVLILVNEQLKPVESIGLSKNTPSIIRAIGFNAFERNTPYSLELQLKYDLIQENKPDRVSIGACKGKIK